MKLQTEKSGIWKSCIGAISELVEEANFEFGDVPVEMKAMDPSHVALVGFRLSKGAFREYWALPDPLSVVNWGYSGSLWQAG